MLYKDQLSGSPLVEKRRNKTEQSGAFVSLIDFSQNKMVFSPSLNSPICKWHEVMEKSVFRLFTLKDTQCQRRQLFIWSCQQSSPLPPLIPIITTASYGVSYVHPCALQSILNQQPGPSLWGTSGPVIPVQNSPATPLSLRVRDPYSVPLTPELIYSPRSRH